MSSKQATMRDAVADLVRDGDTVAIEGFTHLICFAAGHEIIRQRKRDLTLARMTPDVIYDQMVAGGVASKLIFSWLGNPGVGSLHAIRRRIEDHDPEPLEIEEYRISAWSAAMWRAPRTCRSSRSAATTSPTSRR
jgi:glutaconate CoA-transferase subunit A